MGINFYQQIFESLCLQPDKVFICWPEKGLETSSYTGREILEKVSLFREQLKKERVQQGQRVLIAMEVDIDLVCILLAIMAHGAVPVLPPAGLGIRASLVFCSRES